MIVRQNYLKFLFILFSVLALSSCKDSRWKPDVSTIKEEVHITRFEKELFTLDTLKGWDAGLKSLIQKYPDVYLLYVQTNVVILHDSAETAKILNRFISNSYWQELYRDVEQRYDDKKIKALEDELTDGFKHIRYYFPKDTLPQIYSMLKGMQPDAIAAKVVNMNNKHIGFSMEMFMGPVYKYYVGIPYPDYVVRRMRSEYITPEILKSYFENKYPESANTDNTLLSHAIYKGKELFFLDIMKPDLPDSLKIEYTGENLKWAKDYEVELWKYFASKDILNKTGDLFINQYLGEGPYTNGEGLPKETPPRLGEWLGWQIIKSYVAEKKDITPDKLFAEKDYQKIMKDSRYRPSR